MYVEVLGPNDQSPKVVYLSKLLANVHTKFATWDSSHFQPELLYSDVNRDSNRSLASVRFSLTYGKEMLKQHFGCAEDKWKKQWKLNTMG